MKRRTFFSWIGVGTLASSLPIALIACSEKLDKTNKSEFKTVGKASELDTNSFILDETDLSQPILVFRNPQTNQIAAVDPKCTHQDCNVELDIAQQLLICPCHNSQFSLDGQVVNKPATKPLITYETKQEGEIILVKTT